MHRIESVNVSFNGCSDAEVPSAMRFAKPPSQCRCAWSHVQLQDDGTRCDSSNEKEQTYTGELWLRNFVSVPSGSATGGHLWNSSIQMARLLVACRKELTGLRVIELGCGLGLPTLVSASFAAEVMATDSELTLLDNLRFNADINMLGSSRLSTFELDFTSLHAVQMVGLGSWDVVVFADVIYNGQSGEALPYVIRALLRQTCEHAACYGGFPSTKRPGIDKFWSEVAPAGLSAKLILDTSWSCIYEFRVAGNSTKTLDDVLEATNGGELESDTEVEPLFSGIN